MLNWEKFTLFKFWNIESVFYSLVCLLFFINYYQLILQYARLKIISILVSLTLTSLQDCNYLQKVESCRAHSCTELDLENCSVTNISAADFYALSSVTYLNLMDNSITVLEKNPFNPLKNLKILNLSSNSITCIENEIFQDLKKLTSLNLGWNQITWPL
jgi:Leucine-rich repeat (LRR) protein